MKGWTADGRPVELTGWQEDTVRSVLLDWAAGCRGAALPAVGRGGGKTTVLVTLARYEQAWAQGEALDDDPRRPR